MKRQVKVDLTIPLLRSRLHVLIYRPWTSAEFLAHMLRTVPGSVDK